MCNFKVSLHAKILNDSLYQGETLWVFVSSLLHKLVLVGCEQKENRFFLTKSPSKISTSFFPSSVFIHCFPVFQRSVWFKVITHPIENFSLLPAEAWTQHHLMGRGYQRLLYSLPVALLAFLAINKAASWSLRLEWGDKGEAKNQ